MSKFHFYQQIDSMDCGPTCLRMIVRYYGGNISIQKLRELTQIGKEGVNLLGIVDAAESIGLRTRPIKIAYNLLVKEAKLPSILHWGQNHFVILYKVTSKKLYIANPNKGLVTCAPSEFKSHWISNKQDGEEEGIALLLEPSPAFYQYKEDYSSPEGAGREWAGLALKIFSITYYLIKN